ncbi:hypothetical protein CAI21_20710 [Alkalilimnicola ehrlichii]|uniref:Uncharacterized protein n=1 Tax=Alkalilimnicola ehrlichii TaxID=351052 RepID=A0A3E0WGE8_9GAMM|nr:hypothetical protein [Alkalilimnicola ehrlichii]RFA24710.1 hypothetical protein CAI21_20710 [Alkalilimnicola ehrlichii]RFA31808.1 hypothetical protein CAL65_21480 [Alkalilimnicola ehrlichii]
MAFSIRTIISQALVAIPLLGVSAAQADTIEQRQMCRSADGNGIEYIAVQAAHEAYLFARVVLPTPGYEVQFVRDGATRYPPSYRLVCKPPRDMVPAVLTEHKARVAVQGEYLDSEIWITDGEGRYPISVWAELPRYQVPPLR